MAPAIGDVIRCPCGDQHPIREFYLGFPVLECPLMLLDEPALVRVPPPPEAPNLTD